MADTLARPASSAGKAAAGKTPATRDGADAAKPRPTALVGIAVALWTAALGLAVLVCLTLTAWVTATHHDGAIHPPLATAIQAWLLAQHAAIGLGGAGVRSFTLMPLGVTIGLGALLAYGGRHAARLSGATDLLDVATSTLALALPYAVIAALLTNPAHDGGSRPSPLGALTGAFVLALVCAGGGALRETGLLPGVLAQIPAKARAATRAGLAASAIVTGFGAVVLALGLAGHAERAARLASSAHGGYVGVALIAVISAAYAPNAVVWASAYSLGPGFAVGAHTSVTLAGAQVGAVPAFPLLAPLPDTGPAPAYAWLVIVGPLLAGVVAGWLLSRGETASTPDADGPWWAAHRLLPAAWGLAAGATGGVALAVIAALSGGSLGGGRMSALGPSPWWVLLFATIEIGLIAAATIWLRGRTRARADAGEAGVDRVISLD